MVNSFRSIFSDHFQASMSCVASFELDAHDVLVDILVEDLLVTQGQ
jgi:hypothetical protein